MSLITEFSSDFSSAIRSRGSDYFQEGRVRIKTGSEWEVYARVRGTREYEVDLSIEDDELVVHCDCPEFEKQPCKHLWATILAADGKGYLRGNGNLGPLSLVQDFVDGYDFYYADESEDDEEEEDGEGAASANHHNNRGRTPAAPFLREETQKRGRLPGWKEQLSALGR